MSKKKNFIMFSLFIFALILSACGNENEEDNPSNSNNNLNVEDQSNNENIENVNSNTTGQSSYEADLAEADEIAKDVLKSFKTIDYQSLYSIASTSLKEQMEEDDFVFGDFDPDNSPLIEHGVSLHDDYFGLKRFDALYNDEHGVFWYEIRTIAPFEYKQKEKLNDPDYVITKDLETMKDTLMDFHYFGVKKNGEGWVVGEIKKSLSSQTLISDKEADNAKETPYIIHEKVPESKIEEVYGDDSDIGF